MVKTLRARFCRWSCASVLSASVILAGCGPEAPPCNDSEVTGSLLEMLHQAHDDRLKDLQVKSKDIATISLDAPEVTAYDDKLKTRSCKLTYRVQVPQDRVPGMFKYMNAVQNPLMNMMGTLGALSAAFGGPDPRKELVQQQTDVALFLSWNQGPLSSDPVRKSVAYRIQKEEGSSDYVVRTNVDVTGSLQYLRIAALTNVQLKRQAEQDKVQAAKQAEIDQRSASGNWRKAIVILDFSSGHNDPYHCSKNNLYCVQARDVQDSNNVAYYELDAQKVDERGRSALLSSQRGGQAVCLVGVQKTQNPRIFSAKGYSTFRNDKGEAVDCLPGAEKENWASLVAQTKKEEAAAASGSGAVPAPARPTAPTAPAVAAEATAARPASPAPGTGPENLMSLITKYEPCGEEAVCLHTGKGNIVWMQAEQMRRMDYALLDRAITSRTPVCLRAVSRTEGKNFSADGLDSAC